MTNMQRRKEQVRSALRQQGYLPSSRDLEADAAHRDMVAFVLKEPRGAPTSMLILAMDPYFLARAAPEDLDDDQAEEWVAQSLVAISEEIDRRIPVPT